MSLSDAGKRLRSARMAMGVSQRELAGRMETAQAALSRVETGQVFPTTDFIDRYAHALGVPVELTFGPQSLPDPHEMFSRMRDGFGGIVFRHGRFYPLEAHEILKMRLSEEPRLLYLEALEKARSAAGRDWRFGFAGEPAEVRAPTAIAAMYWEVIDWIAVRGKLDSELRRLDAKIRNRAWEITECTSDPQRVISGEWVSKGARDGWKEGVKALTTLHGARGEAR